MKKRIAAMLLAAVMFFHIGGEACRPKAVGAGTATALVYVAYNLYAVMTGRWDDCAEALGCFIENGVEGWQKAFVGSEDTPSWFCTGWNQIANTVSGWFDDGTIELSDEGKVYLTYSMYLELCTMMYDYVDLSLDLGSSLEHGVLNASFDKAISCSKVFKPDCFTSNNLGCSYAPIYYNDTEIYISQLYFRGLDYTSEYGVNSHCFAPVQPTGSWYLSITGGSSYSQWCEIYSPAFLYSSTDNNCYFYYTFGVNKDPYVWNLEAADWWFYDSAAGKVKSVKHSEVDTTLSQGYLMTEGHAKDFIDTITEITAAPDTSQIDDLSDSLDDLLVLNPDPGLVIDPDPAITTPTDAVTITDIPLVDDMTLTDVMADTMPIGLDMQLPKTIFDKFPFSLPFDLYRLLTIFVAEPVTPVFRIPISNVNVDMSAFKDNQTLGQYSYSETFEPMFEIDEEIVIDFSGLPFIQAISYTCFIVGFIAFLILITTKLIHH